MTPGLAGRTTCVTGPPGTGSDNDVPCSTAAPRRVRRAANDAAAELVAETAGPSLQQVFLAHLSSDCNHPDSACACVRRALEAKGHGHVRVETCFQDKTSTVWRFQSSPQPTAGSPA